MTTNDDIIEIGIIEPGAQSKIERAFFISTAAIALGAGIIGFVSQAAALFV